MSSYHLGNVRVIREGYDVTFNEYEPFGEPETALRHSITNPLHIYTYGDYNRWQFNGKETQPKTGMLDYGARMYDGLLGRWTSQDPLAEKYTPVSPYAYCNNNPIRYIDPDGRKWVDAKGNIMWQNGKWTKYATRDAMRVGVAMRATETGVKAFNHVANSPSAIQLEISPEIKMNGLFTTRGEFEIGNDKKIIKVTNGGTHPHSGKITIYEGSIKAELEDIVPPTCETGQLIKSLPAEKALNGAIGSVGVHESIHTTPINLKQNMENAKAKRLEKPIPHDLEEVPTRNQNKYLKELLNKD